MQRIIKRSARGILLSDDQLVLIKRTRPGQDPYWVTVGGGVEPTDADVEAALHREVFEELAGVVKTPRLVHLITDSLDGGLGVQLIFAARLVSMRPSARTGSEFTKPERGAYEVELVPFASDAVRGINLMPPELADFIAENIAAITAVIDNW
ncbi:NUDIX domain-containing protein [Kitasatospora hibisci]|uniref:NUDIX hydrolase n=1 Tax=Kitasatospora hibisci TaxID=3369522 RepID=UPI0037546363